MIQIRTAAQRGFLAALLATLALFTLSACNKTPAPSVMVAPPTAPAVTTGRSISGVSASPSGGSEAPPVASSATRTFEGTFNAQAALLAWTVTYSGMRGDGTAVHFHGPAVAAENADVAVPIMGSAVSPIKGEAMLSGAQAAALT